MSYEVKLSKYNGQMRWLCIERPTGSILCASTFEDKARELAAFQNKHKQWATIKQRVHTSSTQIQHHV